MKKRLLFAALCLVLLLSCVGCSAKKPGVDLRVKLDALTVSDEDLGIKDQFSALSDITGGSIDDALVGRWVSADGRTSYTYAADGTQKIESEDYGNFDVKYTCITCGDYKILCEEVPMTSSDAEGNATESTALSYTAYEIENDVLYMAMVEEHDPMYTTNQTALVSMFKADGSGSAARSMAKNPIDLSCLNGTWVTEKGSFTEAAEACYISQSAISQQIQSLEKEIGVKLFERKNRKFTLTSAGEHFYNKTVVLSSELERI